MLGRVFSRGVVLLLVYVVAATFADDAPVVELANGKVKGEEKESRDDRDFYAYRGIPYAKPPVGPLRFEVRKISIRFD